MVWRLLLLFYCIFSCRKSLILLYSWVKEFPFIEIPSSLKWIHKKKTSDSGQGEHACSQSEVAGEPFLYNLVEVWDALEPGAQAKVVDQRLSGVVRGVQQTVDHLGILRADDGEAQPQSSVLCHNGRVLAQVSSSPYFCQAPSSSSPPHWHEQAPHEPQKETRRIVAIQGKWEDRAERQAFRPMEKDDCPSLPPLLLFGWLKHCNSRWTIASLLLLGKSR